MTTEIKHSDREHALLSASSSHRWLVCTPSVRVEEQLPDSTSEYAEEGTLAHEIAELKLRKYFIEPMSQRTFNTRLNKMKKKELFQEEMLRHTDTYLDYLKELQIGLKSMPYVAVEKKIDYGVYAPEGFGTVDCLIIGGDTLYINDFKYGKGVAVSAEDNPQMKLYALGAYLEYSFLYPIKQVHLAIIQPRLDSISEWSCPIDDLLTWGEEIKPIAQKAFKGEGEFVPGEHCKFCRAKAQCRARSEMYTALNDFGMKKPPLLSNGEVGQVLKQAIALEAWVKALKEYALKECLKGNDVAGWKAVHGRGSRDYTDIDTAFEHLKKNGVKEALLYERVPLTVAKLEKELGKKEFNSLLVDSKLIRKNEGKPTIAPLDDAREAITNAPDAKDDFK